MQPSRHHRLPSLPVRAVFPAAASTARTFPRLLLMMVEFFHRSASAEADSPILDRLAPSYTGGYARAVHTMFWFGTQSDWGVQALTGRLVFLLWISSRFARYNKYNGTAKQEVQKVQGQMFLPIQIQYSILHKGEIDITSQNHIKGLISATIQEFFGVWYSSLVVSIHCLRIYSL